MLCNTENVLVSLDFDTPVTTMNRSRTPRPLSKCPQKKQRCLVGTHLDTGVHLDVERYCTLQCCWVQIKDEIVDMGRSHASNRPTRCPCSATSKLFNQKCNWPGLRFFVWRSLLGEKRGRKRDSLHNPCPQDVCCNGTKTMRKVNDSGTSCK